MSYYLDADILARAVHRGQRLKEGQHAWIRVPPTADQHPDLNPPLKSSRPDGVVNDRPVSVRVKEEEKLKNKAKEVSCVMEITGFFCGSPLRLVKAHDGEVLHDGYIHVVLGL